MKHVLKQDSCVLATTFSFMPRLDDVTLLTRKRNYFAFHAVNRFNAQLMIRTQTIKDFMLNFFVIYGVKVNISKCYCKSLFWYIRGNKFRK